MEVVAAMLNISVKDTFPSSYQRRKFKKEACGRPIIGIAQEEHRKKIKDYPRSKCNGSLGSKLKPKIGRGGPKVGRGGP